MWEPFSRQVVGCVALDVKDPAIKWILALMEKEPELLYCKVKCVLGVQGRSVSQFP